MIVTERKGGEKEGERKAGGKGELGFEGQERGDGRVKEGGGRKGE